MYLFCTTVTSNSVLATIPFVATDPKKLYSHVLRYMSWPHIVRYKKHKAIAHCHNVPNELTKFRNIYNRVSGIYKITFLPFRLFTYYGSSSNLGMRFKYHYFNGPKQKTFLGLFVRVFGWENFSITVVELCVRDQLHNREDWYLSQYKPLLNILMSSGPQPMSVGLSLLTRSKISLTLSGRQDSDETRTKKSIARIGELNPFFGKGPGIKALDLAAQKTGTKVYAYDVDTFTLVGGKPFRSLRMTSDALPVGHSTLSSKLDTGKPFKGYYYYTTPQYPK